MRGRSARAGKGVANMSLVDFTMRHAIPAFGVGVRWLREALIERDVSVRITETCLREFALDAEAAASNASGDAPYAQRLRREIATRADFLRAWTGSDDRLDVADRSVQHLVAIARKYALPRAWTLSEPIASAARNPTPTYLYWASAS
jgi:hypothetical protein